MYNIKQKTGVIKLVTIVLVIIIIVLSCNDKNNIIGFQGGRVFSYQIEFDTDIFHRLETFRDTMQVYTASDRKLILSNESRVLLRFMSLPDTSIKIEKDPILTLHKISPITTEKEEKTSSLLNIYMYILKGKMFNENNATWKSYDGKGNWTPGGELSVIKFPIHTKNDTLIQFNICKHIINDWRLKPTENFGVAIVADFPDDSLIEFHSWRAPEAKGPVLIFEIINEEEDKENELIRRVATAATFIHKVENNANREILQLSNIPPTSMYTLFDVRYDEMNVQYRLRLRELGILNDTDWRRIVITRAILRLHIKENNYINRINLDLAIPKKEPDLENIDYMNRIENMFFTPFLKPHLSQPTNKVNLSIIDTQKYIDINISGHLQNLISNDNVRANHGLVLFNNNLNRDFSSISFYDLTTVDEITRPKIILDFTILK